MLTTEMTRASLLLLAGIYGGSLIETTLSQISVHGCVLAGVFLGFGYMNRVEDCDMSYNGVGLVSHQRFWPSFGLWDAS